MCRVWVGSKADSWRFMLNSAARRWDFQNDIPRIFGLCAEAERVVSRVSTAWRRRSRP